MQRLSFLFLLLAASISQIKAQRTDQPWQLDLAAGLHTIYAPVQDLTFSRPELISQLGFGKPLGHKQNFAVTLQLGYARNNYQGDAVYLQLLGQYTPVIAHKIETGIGIGFGYRLGGYASTPHRYNGTEWQKGRGFKGMYQVPIQLSLGYRSLHFSNYELRPYLAYQLQPVLGYNPDLSPLPVSATLLGIKLQKH